ncbi:uncharacterized protein EI97DRAFT_497508 [Westerdykella ornata]|uniref:Uncharacterized protein n=1 Tax=Westerdykella ornata TaxID=318751 RepID=A0A6A6JVU9_WESOR|nr:uncharacterized protein EI97DRAFT_497508 [Westerdykella ornata]KAF2280740.1 hypothetical protein EI97DRAFT_497508 [Westerdykella ornata]
MSLLPASALNPDALPFTPSAISPYSQSYRHFSTATVPVSNLNPRAAPFTPASKPSAFFTKLPREISHASMAELGIVLPVPHNVTPKVQYMELRMKIELLPGADYMTYRANFSRLETLWVPSLRAMSISLEFTAVSKIDASPHVAEWTSAEKQEWEEKIVKVTKKEVERVGRRMLGGTWREESWETTIEPDAFGQYAEKYSVKK